jgi:hypothetical protein
MKKLDKTLLCCSIAFGITMIILAFRGEVVDTILSGGLFLLSSLGLIKLYKERIE